MTQSYEMQKVRKEDTIINLWRNNPSLVFRHTVGTVLPLLPFGYLDLGVVRRSEPKIRVNDDFVHLKTEGGFHKMSPMVKYKKIPSPFSPIFYLTRLVYCRSEP